MLENYDPKKAEPKWQRYWEREGIYRFEQKSKKPVYSIDTPPPTVSGDMHLGHAFSYSHMDFIARYKRMRGYNLFYPFGFDDNGLATERFVEKKLGIRGTDMPRQEFVKICLQETKEIEAQMKRSWSSLGISPDWNIVYRTIDRWCQKTSQRSFIELYKKGRIYRKEAPIMWCPECRTSLAQVEVEDKEKDSVFVYMKFELEHGNSVTIATTRPELMPACVAIYVHPEDERYKHLIGRKAKLPFFGRSVGILPNEDVDMNFGTGIVYHCTFGDVKDIEWTEKYHLPIIQVINKDGRLNENAGKYRGMDIKHAREAIIADLENLKLIEKKEPVRHVVNVHERCGTEIEFIVSKQWFIKYLDLKEEFLAAGRKIKWHPEHMRIRYENWIRGLKWDWNISRQRFFGIPFPVWYCKKCSEIVLADEKDLPVDPTQDKPKKSCKCGSKEFEGEKDVLDTWATSSLTPQIALRWREDDDFFKKMYPMSLRPQAHDIITFWAFNTVVKGLLHEGEIPWQDIMISGHALDPHGMKMSKSKGNVIEPRYVIEKFSADCLRFWAAGAKLGEDLPSVEKDWVTAQKFITKLWNAAKFTVANLKDYDVKTKPKLQSADKWILAKLQRIIESVTIDYENYEYFRATKAIVQFFWHDLCDNYIEMCKYRLYKPDVYGMDSKLAAQYTLYKVLLDSLKLLAPVIPHVTEEIYHIYFIKHEKARSIHISTWPIVDEALKDKDAEEKGQLLVDIIAEIRSYKAEHGLPLNYEIKKVKICADESYTAFLKAEKETIEGAMNILELDVVAGMPAVEERIVEIVPDFSTIGPEFKQAAKKVVEFLKTCDKKKFAYEMKNKGEVAFDEIKIMPKHIKEIKKEILSEGEKVDILNVPGREILISIPKP